MSLEEFIPLEISRHKPVSLLLADDQARVLATAFLNAHPASMAFDIWQPGITLALVGATPAAQDAPATMRLLGGLIRQIPVVLVVAGENGPLKFSDFLALGMQRLYGPDADARCVYGFDLHTYKPAPDWLNSKYWAHPELWKP